MTVATPAQERTYLLARLADAERRVAGLRREQTADERDQLAEAQVRADGVARLFGQRALPPLPGESPLRYRQRLATALQKHSPRFASARLDGLDSATLAGIENEIYSDASGAAHRGDDLPGRLVPVQEIDVAGRQITRFTGDPLAWMAPFMGTHVIGRFNRRDAE